MASRKPLTDDEGEVRELTDRDLAEAVPLSKLPEDLKELLSSRERTLAPDTEPKKGKQTAA
jgi:hypothetical protein